MIYREDWIVTNFLINVDYASKNKFSELIELIDEGFGKDNKLSETLETLTDVW